MSSIIFYWSVFSMLTDLFSPLKQLTLTFTWYRQKDYLIRFPIVFLVLICSPWNYISFLFLFLRFFLMWTIFKVFIEFVTILFLFYALVFWLWGMWDLTSPTRNWTCTPCIGRWSPNHWTAREVPEITFLKNKFSHITLLLKITS